MDLQFDKMPLQLMQPIHSESKCCEETKEIRLGENAPDAASVIAAWGQVLLRSKEWRGSGMSVSGGVLVFIAYSAAETGQVQTLEEWIPFKLKWDFPDPGREGKICAWGSLTELEARLISDRKIMVSANVCITAQAYCKQTADLPIPREDGNIELLTNTYPLTIIREAGEHTFTLEDGENLPNMEKWLRYEAVPQMTEKRVMGDKLVFRGELKLHMLGLRDGKVESYDMQMPFSQFAELDQSYEDTADAFIIPMVTSMEATRSEEDKWTFQCAVTGQYQICDTQTVTLPEDGYSLSREVTLHREETVLPSVLQMTTHSAAMETTLACEGQVLDAAVYPGQGMLDRSEQAFIQPGWCQLLYTDPEGNLRGEPGRWELSIPMPTDDTVIPTLLWDVEDIYTAPTGAGVTVTGQLSAREMTVKEWAAPTLLGITYGEEKAKDPDRPSLILRRAGEQSLWDIAKGSGTTVAAIQKANNLADAPGVDTMLIIPIN
ncbi:MAG: DUF3794 domain-containing protein [Ruminococcaceae bacterium]|nr:DUF3794 domain-containing protein [Oscillospiraceae bacterium]